jgi:hypothetical protein
MRAVFLALSLCIGTLALCSPRARADASDACASAYEDAQLFRMRGRYVQARDALLMCLQPACPRLLRGDCQNWLPEVEQSLPSVVFAVIDVNGRDVEGARIYADGKLLEGYADGHAHAIDPGVYTLRIEAPGHRAEEQTLTIRQSEKNRMVKAHLASDGTEPSQAKAKRAPGVITNDVTPEPEPEPKRRRIPTLSYVLGGSALAGFGVMTTFAVLGKHEHTRLSHSCAPNCTDKATEAGRRDYILADVALGVSLALTGTAVWSYFWGKARTERAPPVVGMNLGKQRASLSYTLRF